ncbi:MAG: molybdate transporter substrate-binding protein [Actinomycetota bacterium]|jgi:molybdate transport system substrate-binding protein
MKKKLIALLALIPLSLAPSAQAAGNSVTVFAASSLTDSYSTLGKQFEASHKGVKVNFSFLASSTLATQIKAGAPADIFVSASPVDMKGVASGEDYLVNRVVLGAAKSSNISKISDLNGKVIWIQCAHEVPCGAAADSALVGEGVTSKPVSYEPKVSSAVAKLVAGEVDAAIIYKTDVLANSKKLKGIEFANQQAASTTYQIAQLRKNYWAASFMNYLKSHKAMKFLQAKGFDVK